MIDYVALSQRINEALPGLPVTIDSMPISVTKGIFFRSNISGDEIDYYLPGLQRASFHLVARSAKYEEGMQILNSAIEALTVHQPEDIGTMHVRYCRPITTPMVFPIDDGNLREFAVRMRICFDYDTESAPWL